MLILVPFGTSIFSDSEDKRKDVCLWLIVIYYPSPIGLAFAMLTLRNPRYTELPPVEVEALADTGSTFLCVPAAVAEALRLETYDHKDATIADGSRRRVPYMGPLEVRFKNRVALGGALVIGDRVLLGAIPMEDLDLVVSPRDRRVEVNPASPDAASCVVMANPDQPPVD